MPGTGASSALPCWGEAESGFLSDRKGSCRSALSRRTGGGGVSLPGFFCHLGKVEHLCEEAGDHQMAVTECSGG